MHPTEVVHRRKFLTTASLAGAALLAARAQGAVRKFLPLSDHPFQLGVASGDPTSNGFVIWTRLAPKPIEGGGMPNEPVEVAWMVAEDEAMTKVVQKGTTVANPEWAHSVHVEVEGLAPDRWYWYQFKSGNDTSPKGRSKTFPSDESTTPSLNFAFASCQHFEAGLFTAYEHMLKENLDLVVHLGDYIYEGPGRDTGVRKHVGGKLLTLEDYRNRHAQYRTDVHLAAMHAACPWLVTWDDHEFENNYATDISEKGVAKEAFLAQRAAAYQAYYEHMPLRRASLPSGPMMQLYRRASYGNLAEFFVLDTRQYRTDQPCGDGLKPPCDATFDPSATILGDAQEKWLTTGLARSKSNWNVMAQQVMVARVDQKRGTEAAFSMDQWPGYEVNRRRLLKSLSENQVKNPIVLTGDIHSNWANELLLDFDDLGSKSVATEFVGTSISSGGNGAAKIKDLDQLLSENPFVKYNNRQRGYVRCQVTPQAWRTDYQLVPFVDKPGAEKFTGASFIVESGDPTLKRV
jgi:alkaline phosphatase D